MVRKNAKRPRCIVIAGPDGAGKTTFAKGFLPKTAKIVHFVNADAIAAGIAPLKPEMAAIAAGRLFLAELDRLSRAQIDFAFESTLSGVAHAERLANQRIGILGGHPLFEIALLRSCMEPRIRKGETRRPFGTQSRFDSKVQAELAEFQ